VGFVLAMRVAKVRCKDLGFFVGSQQLQRDQDQETPQINGTVDVDKQGGDGYGGENVGGIADFGIDAGCGLAETE
jgi:hypothetical protein